MPPLAYTLKLSPRARHLRLRLRADGSLLVTAPKRVPKLVIDKFIHDHAGWIAAKQDKLKRNPRPYSWVGTTAELKKFKSSAMRLAKDRLVHFNQVYGFRVVSVGIRNQKSRWGSCSSAGRLNFSYKIALLPPHLADYIIVHELCHLGEMNHSKRFWALVAKTMPEYRQLKHELHYGSPHRV